MKKWISLGLTLLAIASSGSAHAELVRGKIVTTEGHVSPNCRTVTLKRNDNGQLMVFRIAASGQEDGILAVTLTALTTGLDVSIAYEPGQTTGCGTEPRIIFATISAPGH